MAVLVTGASGFIGRSLVSSLLEKGERVYGLYRQKSQIGFIVYKLTPLFGDITQPDLGIENPPKDIDAVIHCAALLSFKAKDRERLYATNHKGMLNLLEWMKRHEIARLYHLSTAYLFNQNDYEISKIMAEFATFRYPEIKHTIFRPSIVIGDSTVQGVPPLSGFYSGVAAIDRAKRWFERKSGLPPLRMRIRIHGIPAARLNLIPIDVVVKNIMDVISQDKTGIFELTHPDPPTLESLGQLISRAIGANIEFVPAFKPNLLERVIARSLRELSPYLQGCYDLPSDIECPPLDGEFLERSIKVFLNANSSRS